MTEDYAAICYRLALAAAREGRLSRAAVLAARCRKLDSQHQNARRLLGLCLYELGDLSGAVQALAPFPDLAEQAEEALRQTKNALETMRGHLAGGRWRTALAAMESVSHQSVRLLRVRGCLLAGAKRYRKAAALFCRALQKDRDNPAILACVAEAAGRKPAIWELLT